MVFIYLFLFRVLSGLQNGLGYAQNRYRLVVSILLIVCSFIPLLFTTKLYGLVGLGILISVAGGVGVENSFSEKISWIPKGIHFWETLATAGVLLACVFASQNILLIACSVYPALIIHKGFINYFSGLAFFEVRTDDPTGKTFSIPLIGKVVTRGGNIWRLLLVFFSLILAVFTFVYGWNVQVAPVIIDLWS